MDDDNVYGAVGVLLVDIASTELAFSLDYFGLCLQYNEQNGDYDLYIIGAVCPSVRHKSDYFCHGGW